MYMSILPACYVCAPCVCLAPAELRKVSGSSGTGVIDCCVPPCGF